MNNLRCRILNREGFPRGIFTCFIALGICLGSSVAAAESEAGAVTESEKANALFQRFSDGLLDRYPQYKTYLGIKTNYGDWDDLSDAAQHDELAIQKKYLQELRESIDPEKLDRQTNISYRLAVQEAEEFIRNFEYRHFYSWPHAAYLVSHLGGPHVGLANMLIGNHAIDDASDAEAYILRLSKFDTVFDQLIGNLKLREEAGAVPPRFVFPKVIRTCRNLISGGPFDNSGEDCPLLADFKKKVATLALDEATRADLIERANRALLNDVKPAYESLIGFLEKQAERSTEDAGVWKFENGEAFYAQRLRSATTTDLTAAEIHEIGLREVERIHEEMREIMRQVEFKGTLQEFFKFLKEDDQFYYPNTDEGRQAYMDRVYEVVDDMRGRLDSFFNIQPKAEMVVKRVEPFREKSAGGAFYEKPSKDGSRPGVYYVNLGNMGYRPKYALESLAYHEAIPGHHMQEALTIELDGIPFFRQNAWHVAYGEGWGLYAEFLAKEIGCYEGNPYSDFGRLSYELLRACRLVVDTGIHSLRWTRKEAVEYYKKNSNLGGWPMVNRHVVWPGQATAYTIGMLKILELRKKAKDALGEAFDIRDFHDVVLMNGSVPLNILEEIVDDYIEDTRKG